MIITSYVVRVCDTDPLGSKQKNIIPYKFVSRRRALNFVKDAMSRGLHVMMNMVELETEDGE